ncbi:MAG: adenylate kinase [Candidatus Thermoplasmatota archaeon]|nr:adenylate kinase [Candidatus Thermoplasmatota archaeon]
MRVIILGAPGSGKGTQAKLLERNYKLTHLPAGDLLRAEIANKTALGMKIENYVNKGKLAPDKIVIKIMKSAIEKHSNFVLDGFPRNLAQAKALEKICDIDLAINIEVDDTTAVRRLSNRRICAQCNAVFHLELNPPKRNNVCDFCSSKLVQRIDDKEEVIKERLKVYEKETSPLIEYYRSKETLKVVDGNKSIEEVFECLEKCIKESGFKIKD